MSAAGWKQRRIISGAGKEIILKNVIRVLVTLIEYYTITSCSNALKGGEIVPLLNNEDNHTLISSLYVYVGLQCMYMHISK